MRFPKATFLWCLLLGISAQGGEYFPLWQPHPPNVTDLMLIYEGGTEHPHWNTAMYAPYISYRDPQSGLEKWLYDGFLFIEFADGRGHAFVPGLQQPARKANWTWLLDRNFDPADGVPMLDLSCGEVRQRIGPPARRRQIVLTLPTPILGQTNWGQLRGRWLDFRNDQDRLAACSWYIDAALQRWHELNAKELDLAGFYWVDEEAPGPAHRQFMRALADIIHARGRQFFWIPYWQAKEWNGDWTALGFDVAWQQPNYFFNSATPLARLQEACDFAKGNRMGLEMEFDDRLISNADVYEPRFDAYLASFDKNGVSGFASMAWYEGGGALHRLATSSHSHQRGLYDRVARFVLRRQQLADQYSTRR